MIARLRKPAPLRCSTSNSPSSPVPTSNAGAAREVAVHVAGKLQRRGSQGHRPLADRRLGARALGGAVGGLQRRVQLGPDHLRGARERVRRLDLAQDLRLAEHLAVERRRHAEDPPERRARRCGHRRAAATTASGSCARAASRPDAPHRPRRPDRGARPAPRCGRRSTARSPARRRLGAARPARRAISASVMKTRSRSSSGLLR